jgi:ParB family transcriptional regulator, chromosome partitioning protein
MEIVNKKLSELTPYAKNPRKNADAVKYVAASIKEFGFKVPVIIDDGGEIIAGHTRVLAAKRLGLETVPCIVADDLTPEQVKAYRLADNKTGEKSGWDFPMLEAELAELTLNMEDFGFEIYSPSENFDFSEFEKQNKSLAGMEEVALAITVPEKFREQVNEWLRNGEGNTAVGRGLGVLKRCGLR